MAGPRTDTPSGNWRSWSLDTYGRVVIAAPYGSKVSSSDMARYVYMSEDYGQTWRIIFDLFTENGGVGTQAHVHGAAYDPWWDAVWIVSGDFENAANWVSFDRGATWEKLALTHQMTTVYPLPGAIMLVSDMAAPNAIFRIPRTSPQALHAEIAKMVDSGNGLTMYGDQMFRLRSIPDAPLVMTAEAGSSAGPGCVYVTYDGYTIRELWKDSTTYVDQGLRTCVGPSVNGVYLGRLDRSGVSGSPNVNAEMLKLTPNI